jgi:hypothetical protein
VSLQNPGAANRLTGAGDQQAINGLLLDPSDVHWPKSSPFQVISASKGVHDADHVEFLRRKGCLSLPSKSISHELVSSYFQHVHPFVPVIDAPQFLQDFDDFERLRTNLLVLWSVFFAAASVCNQADPPSFDKLTISKVCRCQNRRKSGLFITKRLQVGNVPTSQGIINT